MKPFSISCCLLFVALGSSTLMAIEPVHREWIVDGVFSAACNGNRKAVTRVRLDLAAFVGHSVTQSDI